MMAILVQENDHSIYPLNTIDTYNLLTYTGCGKKYKPFYSLPSYW